MKQCVLSLFLAALAGCAARTSAPAGPAEHTQATTQRADDPASFSLEKITPVPKLPSAPTRPTTAPSPLEALENFARARAALQANPPQRATAINLLEKAIALDPYSPELYEELARAYAGSDKAIAALEKAVKLDPDNLELRERLGRHYLVKSRLDDALLQLRLAIQTTDYAQDSESAAVVDFLLGRTLQRKGYLQAALDQFYKLIGRLEKPSMSFRSNPELLGLMTQPELLFGQIGELHALRGQHKDAVRSFLAAVERAPDNFELNASLVRSLLAAGQAEEATQRAVALISRFRASADSLKLLREIYQKAGRGNDLVEVLQKLQREKPEDRSILFALADATVSAGRAAEAEKMLLDAARHSRDSIEIIKRLFEIYNQRDDVESAVRLLVVALAQAPDSLREMSPLWAELLKPSRRNRLRPPLLQKLKVQPQAEASRLFWLSRIADLWNRDAMARSALEQGAAIKPAFGPLCRLVIAEYWSRPDWDDKQKREATACLVDSVREDGNAALAAELEGLALLRQKGQASKAAENLAQSIALGNKAADVQLTLALALRASGETSRSENQLWKVVSDHPSYEDAYVELFRYYFEQNQAAKAVNVLTKWLAADPGNIHARVLRARIMQQAGRPEAAEGEFLALFREQPSNPEILGALYNFFSETQKIDQYISMLEEVRQRQPGNREAVEQLVLIYYERKRLPEALRVLDAARSAVEKDADLLYYIAHLYGRVDQKDTEEKLLEEVIRLDRTHAPASNDLGYTWADAGKNLSRAEHLIRAALEVEPDNQSFLDSLGWVLYKRSKFAEARVYFEKAIGPAARPDPVVLDHMGDVLYRLGNKADAEKTWRHAGRRLEETSSERDDLKKLRLQLNQKLKQLEQGQKVDVAPVAEPAQPSTQVRS